MCGVENEKKGRVWGPKGILDPEVPAVTPHPGSFRRRSLGVRLPGNPSSYCSLGTKGEKKRRGTRGAAGSWRLEADPARFLQEWADREKGLSQRSAETYVSDVLLHDLLQGPQTLLEEDGRVPHGSSGHHH